VRELLSVDGRPPRPNDEPCNLKMMVPEPLAMLLPGQQNDYAFGVAGRKRSREQSTVMLDYRSVTPQPAKVTWSKDCVDIELRGRSRGRVWVDALTGDVLRLDEHLTESFEFPYPKEHIIGGSPRWMTLDRADSMVVYKPVEFRDPPETIHLPESIVSVQVVQNSGRPRLRIFQRFSNYRRFITDSRIVDDPR